MIRRCCHILLFLTLMVDFSATFGTSFSGGYGTGLPRILYVKRISRHRGYNAVNSGYSQNGPEILYVKPIRPGIRIGLRIPRSRRYRATDLVSIGGASLPATDIQPVGFQTPTLSHSFGSPIATTNFGLDSISGAGLPETSAIQGFPGDFQNSDGASGLSSGYGFDNDLPPSFESTLTAMSGFDQVGELPVRGGFGMVDSYKKKNQ